MTGEADKGKGDDKGGAGKTGDDAENLLDAASKAAAGKSDADKAADKAAADAAAKAAGNGALAFNYDPKGSEQVFGKPGDDGRPANVPAKYWDADKKAVKADVVFNQLRWAEGKLGKPLEILGAPVEGSNYEVALPKEFEGVVEIDAEDPRVQGLLEVARKHDLNQTFVSEVLAVVAGKVKAMSAENLTAEIGKLGDNGAARLKNLDDFVKANLTPEQADSLKSLVTSSAAFEAIEALISKAAPPKFASKEDQAAAIGGQQALKDEWNRKYFATNDKGERLMAIDPEYAKEVDALRDRVFGTTRRDASGRAVAA